MMRVYALLSAGVVAEIIHPAVYDAEHPDWTDELHTRVGQEIPIEERFTAELIAMMVEVTDLQPKPKEGWLFSADSGGFSEPTEYVPTQVEILAKNTASRDYFLWQATLAIAPLQDAIDLEDASAQDVALLKSWKQYRVLVDRVDLSLKDPVWPIVIS